MRHRRIRPDPAAYSMDPTAGSTHQAAASLEGHRPWKAACRWGQIRPPPQDGVEEEGLVMRVGRRGGGRW